jgi:signal transduction histidine kinase
VSDTVALRVGAGVLSAVVTLAAVWLGLTYGRGRPRQLFAVAGGVVCAWSVTLVGVVVAPDAVRPTLFLLAWVFQWGGLVGWFCFLSEYAGEARWRDRRVQLALGATLAVAVVAIATTRSHGLVFAGLGVSPAGHLVFERGVGYAVLAVPATLLLAGVLALLVRLALRSRRESRRQSALLGVAVAVPVGLWLLRATEVLGPGWLSYLAVGNAVQMGVVAVGLYGGRLLSVTPVTRSAVLSALPDPILVVDDGRVVDYNEATREVFPDVESGEPLAAVAPALIADESEPAPAALVDRVEPTVDGRPRSLVVSHTTVDDSAAVVALRDVTAAESYAADLERQTEQLDRFTSVVSHDLRNPISVVQGYVEVARRETDDEEVASFLANAEDATDRMTEIVDDALTLANEGEVVEETEPVVVADIARDSWQTVDTRGATLRTPTDRVVAADPGRLRSAFENLFRNAVEHATDDPSTLTVTVETTPGGFAVVDDGTGIDADADTVFREGYSTDDGGTGLGLSIVRSVARAHGGDVQLGDGDGARFEFTGFRVVDDDQGAGVAAE